jgi:hypothetical protein
MAARADWSRWLRPIDNTTVLTARTSDRISRRRLGFAKTPPAIDGGAGAHDVEWML